MLILSLNWVSTILARVMIIKAGNMITVYKRCREVYDATYSIIQYVYKLEDRLYPETETLALTTRRRYWSKASGGYLIYAWIKGSQE